MPEARLIWQEGLCFKAHTSGDQTLIVDSLKGTNMGPSPMALVLVALGGCTAMDVISILQKQRQPVKGLEVVVRAERVPEHPRVYTGYEITYVVRGAGVSQRAVERAVSLSEEKYCSVGAMLGQSAPIRSSVVLEAD